MVGNALGRGDVVDYTMGSRRIRVLVVSASAFGHRHGRIFLALAAKVDQGLRRCSASDALSPGVTVLL